jgi:ADP-heptose:LPS heptosyltransferase
MKILVRLPNWLGDMVMSVPFLHQLPHFFGDVELGLIARKGIHELLPFFPASKHQFIFSKEEYKSIRGLVKFGRQIRQTERYDLFFCLPDSLSTAIAGAATGAHKRIGYKKEARQLLLTNSYKRPEGLHRVEEYIRLLENYTGKKAAPARALLHHNFPKQEYIAVNINSEASSRRLTITKATELLTRLRQHTDRTLMLIGARGEKEFVESVLAQLPDRNNIINAAGTTTLPGLTALLASARLLLTTDSGPAHLANALGTNTVVLFGAGDENNTAPYNPRGRSIIRLGQLSCEPCRKNVCVRFGTPQCLERLDSDQIIQTMQQYL